MSEPVSLQPEELRKLQMVLLEMLIEVDRICRKHDIKYSLAGGTLLGAVRHKGFIPWDDDLDVAMQRKEYERFKCACKTELNDARYFFQDYTTDPHYRWGYTRIRRKNSEFVRVGQEHMKMQTGIFLDIFPADNVPDFYPLRLLHALHCFFWRKTLYSETGIVTGKNALIRGWYRVLRKIPRSFVFGRLEKMSRRWMYKETKLNRTLTFPPPKGTFGTPNRWHKHYIDIEFEGLSFMAIRDYKEYLSMKFGDYMQLPPPEKRHWHPAAKLRLPED